MTPSRKRWLSYVRWRGMMLRCYDKKNRAYRWYGARGITVCKPWHSFERFYKDVGDAPAGKSFDRTDNSKGYEPTNWRWATQFEQVHNSRSMKYLTLNGQSKSFREWAALLGIHQTAISQRLRRGWSVERAITTRNLTR